MPVGLYGRWFLEWRYLQQIVVDEVSVTDTALPTVVESVAHTTSAVVVTDQVTTDRVRFTVETPDTTFVYVNALLCVFVPRISTAHERRAVAGHVEVVEHEVTELAVEFRVQKTFDPGGVLRVSARIARGLLTFLCRGHKTLMSGMCFICSTAGILIMKRSVALSRMKPLMSA